MKHKNRVVLLNIASTLLLYIISFITAPLFAALLGTGSFGDLSVFNTWVSAAAMVMTLHTTGTIANARVEYPEEEQKAYQSSAMSLSLLFFALCFGTVMLLLGPVSRLLEMDPLLVVMIMVTALGTFGVHFMNQKLNFELQAGRNMAISVSLAVLNLGTSLLFVMLLPEEHRLYGRAGALMLSYGLFGITSCALILIKGKTLFRKQYWKFCLGLSVPVVFYGLTDLLLGHSDLVMLRSMDGSESSGIYGLAYQISAVMFTIFTAINTSWVAFFFHDMKQGHRETVLRQSRNFLELYTVLACGFILLAPEVFRLLAPVGFHSGTSLIPLMVASFYLNFLCTFPYNYECYHKKMHVISIVTIVSALLNVGLNYILILRMGMMGAAVATLLSRVFQFSTHFLYSRFVLGKRDFIFGVKVWGLYAAGFGAAMLLVTVFDGGMILRWGLGAVLGVWELLRIRKRHALI